LPRRAETWRIVTSLTVALGLRPAVADYPPGTLFGPRRLDDFELVWLISGGARWRDVAGGPRLTLRPGDVLLIPPGTTDEFRWDERSASRHGYVHFRARTAVDSSGWPLCRAGQLPGPLGGLLEYLLWLSEEPAPGWRERAEDVLATTVRAFVSGPLPQPHSAAEPPALAAALEQVRRLWAGGMRPVRLAELAAAASVSPAYLARQFHDRYGCGPVAGLERIRLERARILLERTNLGVAEVGRACGFADPLHFSRRFRAVVGVAPRDYRAAPVAPESTPAALQGLARRLMPDAGRR
jgi:AraC-like DNA-binding protein